MAGLTWLASHNQHVDYKTATAASIKGAAVLHDSSFRILHQRMNYKNVYGFKI